MATSDNVERRDRILDAAAELFTHYGFDKSTVSEIARTAGVSKGAIYLHFESKDQLLEALIIREMKVYAEEWLARLAVDPEGGTIAGLYKNSLYALSSSRFMTAIFKQDGRILGSYLRKPDNFFRSQPQNARYQFVQRMQEAGAVRQDIDASVIAHIMNMLAYGLVAMDEIMDREEMPPAEDVIEGIAAIMDRALAPAGGGDPEVGKAIVQEIADGVRTAFEGSYQQVEVERDNDQGQ